VKDLRGEKIGANRWLEVVFECGTLRVKEREKMAFTGNYWEGRSGSGWRTMDTRGRKLLVGMGGQSGGGNKQPGEEYGKKLCERRETRKEKERVT